MKYKFSNIYLAIGCLWFVLNSVGCATVTKGSSQSVTINTNPSGAQCILSREGAEIGAVNPTPGTIVVEKDKDTISVLCKKAGYQDAAGALSAEFQAMTLGNILIGGVIGLGVDAVSGALHKYAPMLNITMIPNEFASVAKRDDFFDAMKDECIADYEKEMAQCLADCEEKKDDTLGAPCKDRVQAITVAKEEKLAIIEAKRQEAKINNESI